MIRAWFGIERTPFAHEDIQLIEQQQEILDTLRVHAQQGGLCMVLGEPGTGKSVLRTAVQTHDPKRLIAPVVSRTLHTYHNVLRILCQAVDLDTDGSDYRCEKRLIEHAVQINRAGKMLVPIIDDAHLLEIQCLRKLRLLFEDFPKNHNLVLVGQMPLLSSIQLSVNADIKSRVTYSVAMRKLAPDTMREFILAQFDRVRLGHNTFSEDALELVVRSCEGVLRRARNIVLGSLLEAVRDKTRGVGLVHVNRILVQPHFRRPDYELEQE